MKDTFGPPPPPEEDNKSKIDHKDENGNNVDK